MIRVRRQLTATVTVLFTFGLAHGVAAADWNSCYVGANAGYASARTGLVETRVTVNSNPPTYPDFNRGSQTDTGWAFGGQVGCDYQMDNSWVAGFRGMWDGSDITGSRLVGPGDYVESTDHVKIGSFGTLVGKVSYLLNPKLQVYGVGGLALVNEHYFGTSPSTQLFAADQTRLGYDVGVGLAWMFAPRWDIWGEYDYIGLGTQNVTFIGEGDNAGVKLDVDSTQHVDKFLMGINYHFDITSPATR